MQATISIFALISALFLVQMYRHRKNGTAPQWLHESMHKDRYVNDVKKRDNLGTSFRSIALIFFLMLGPFFIIYTVYGIISPYGTWYSFGHNTAISILTVILCLFTPLYFSGNLRKHYSYYNEDLVKKEAEETLRNAYGAREIATRADLTRATHPYGFYIGAPYWHWFGDGMITTIGGAGSGKNAALLTPGYISPAFTSTGTSIFALDPKGESAAICGRALRESGYTVYQLNPTDIFGMGTDHFNLFDTVSRNSPDLVPFCQTIAAALLPIGGKSDVSDHFADKGQGLLTAYMLYMIETGDASFPRLYDLVMEQNWPKRLTEMSKMGGIVGKESGAVLGIFELGGSKEVSGIYSDAQKSLKAFRNPAICGIAQASSFSLNELIEKPTAVFINIPFGELKDSAGWIRAMVAILSRVMENRTDRARRLYIVLDEFTRLGHVQQVEDGFVTLRGFGVTYNVVVQDFQQLKQNYPHSYKSFFSSAAVKHVLNVEDYEMAKLLSDMTGKAVNTVAMGENHLPHIVQRPVVSPDEIMNNHNGHYLFLRGLPNVIKLPKTYYFNNPNFNGLYDENPLHVHHS